MTDRRRRLLLAGLACLPAVTLWGCGREPELREAGFSVFGQIWTLTFFDTPPARINNAIDAAEAIVEPLYRRLHPWKDSELTRLNQRLATYGEAKVSEDLQALIQSARPLFEASGGLFDPTIGGLTSLWGFHADGGRQHRTEPPPEAMLDAWLDDAPSLDDVHVVGNRISVSNRRVQFDFNALAEGFAARRVLAAIESLGVRDCLLDTGGDLFTLGRPGNRSWQLGINDPLSNTPLGGVELSGKHALCSSGNYERRIHYRGHSYGHILDPSTARPAQSNAGTTVLHRDPLIADGAATALMLLTPQHAKAFADQVGLNGTLLVAENGDSWRDEDMRQAMHQGRPASSGRTIDWQSL